jgi:hypothetical protein
MSEPLIPAIVTQVIATVSGAIVSVGIPLVLTKLNKINRLHTTVFGLQEVSSVGGLVENVEQNTDKIGSLEDNQDGIQKNQEKIIDVLKSLESKMGENNLTSQRLNRDSEGGGLSSNVDGFIYPDDDEDE